MCTFQTKAEQSKAAKSAGRGWDGKAFRQSAARTSIAKRGSNHGLLRDVTGLAISWPKRIAGGPYVFSLSIGLGSRKPMKFSTFFDNPALDTNAITRFFSVSDSNFSRRFSI
jgi:hypothetical protein